MQTKLTSGYAIKATTPLAIDFTGAPAVTATTLLGIVDATLGADLYVADDPSLGGQWQGRILVLDFPTGAVANSDQLFVFINDGRTAAGDDTLTAFAAAQHADEAAALAVLDVLATENTLRGVADDINNFAVATHQDLQQLDTDLKAAAAQAHTDAGTIAADVVQLDTDLKAAAAQAHTDAGTIAADVVQLDKDLNAAAAQAHTDAGTIAADVVQLDKDLNAAAAQAHTDAGAIAADVVQLDADLKAAAAQAHTDAGAIAADVVQLDTDLKAAATQAHTDAGAIGVTLQQQLPFAPVRGTTVRLTVGPSATTNPVAFPKAAAVTSYRVRNEATSPSPVTWALAAGAPASAPVIPTPYDVTGANGVPGDKTIDPGGVEIIALTAAQIAAAAAGTLLLTAICPAGGSAILSVTLGTGA